jgi:hypothetical protein
MAIYIGQFNEEQCRKGEDKAIVLQKKDETGLKYTRTRLVKKGGKIVGLKVWLLTDDEYYNSNEI